MFLLGRGRRRVETLVRVGVRYRGSVRRIMPKDKIAVKKGGVERDAMGRPILPQREKSVGTFNPLSAKSLTHELFETDGIGRVELDLPVLQPRDLAPGVATRFDDEDGTAPHRVFGVPKHMLLEYRILGTPCSVTTSTTLSIIRALEESKEKTARLVLNGRPGCGKSFLLLQAAEYASASGEWIVLYIPRARRLVDGSTPYHYSLQSQTYLQPRAALETLHRLGVANQHLLELIFTTAPLVLDGGAEFPAGTQLLDVVDGVRNLEDPAHAVPALEYVLRELGEQTLFPVLIAIDDFQALAGPTMYRDPRFHMIRPHHLSMPRLLLEYASGRKPLARGMVLGALTRSDTQFPVTAQLADALRLPLDFSPSPRSVRERRSSQLAWYLDAEAPPPRPEPEWVPREVDEDDIEAEAEELEGVASEGEEGAEATSGVEGTEATQDAERSDEDSDSDSDSEGAEEAAERAPWTGWRVYDPPMYEDSVAPSPAEPFPAPRPAEVWRGLVLKDMDDDAPSSTATTASTNSEVDAELDAEEREEEMSAGVAAAGQGKMSKSMRRRAKERAKEAERLAAEERVAERALRAIRVPDALSVREAAALFELWLDSGVLRTGGQRRAARRAEIETLEEWRDVKDEVDEPEVDEDGQARANADESDEDELAALSQITQEEWEDGIEEATEFVDELEEDEDDRELDSEEMDDVRALEDAVEVEDYFEDDEEDEEEGVVFDSLDGERGAEVRMWERTMREGAEVGSELEGVAAVEVGDLLEGGEMMVDDAPTLSEDAPALSGEDATALAEDAAATVSESDPAALLEDEAALSDDATVRAADDAYASDAASDSDVEYDYDSDGAEYDSDGEVPAMAPAELDLGEDAGLAQTLSKQVRAALEDPSLGADLLANPLVADTPATPDSGADELFMGKYVESSGNARAFVWGGLLGTLQT